MTTLSTISPTNDLTIDSSGLLATCSGLTAYSEIVAAAIRTLVGELQLDIEQGVPWMSTILANRNQIEIWKYYVEKRVKEFDFVDHIESFDVTYDKDKRQVDFTLIIVSTDGTTTTIEQSLFG